MEELENIQLNLRIEHFLQESQWVPVFMHNTL